MDLLDVQGFADSLARTIAQLPRDRTPLTIGIYGEWGSGKTTFLEIIAALLDEMHGIHAVWFNAWRYNQEESLWAALLQRILDHARVDGPWYRRVWKKLRIWWAGIDWSSGLQDLVSKIALPALRALLTVVGIALLATATLISPKGTIHFAPASLPGLSLVEPVLRNPLVGWIAGITSLAAARPDTLFHAFSARLRIDATKWRRQEGYRSRLAALDDFASDFGSLVRLVTPRKPLVIIIDDLDRCLPDQTLQILEAMKVFLDVEGCVFLLAVDREIIEEALAQKYSHADDLRKRRFVETYIDKIVQLPFTLPPLSVEKVHRLITMLWTDDADVALCAPILAGGARYNPRRAKRTVLTFTLLRDYVALRGQIDPRTVLLLAKLVVIQAQARDLYRELIESPELLEEIETYHRRPGRDDSALGALVPATTPRAKRYAEEYPLLQTVLGTEVIEGDSVVGLPVRNYIYMVSAVVEELGPSPGSAADAAVREERWEWNLPRRMETFVGRESTLAAMRNELKRREWLTLVGMGGVGKTQLALEFAHRQRREYASIAWLACENRSLTDQVAALADALDIAVGDRGDLRAMLTDIQAHLATRGRYLLVFDGIEDPLAMAESFSASRHGEVLLTSRNRVRSGVGAVLDVDVFARHESIRLLRSCGEGQSPELVARLADELGDLPVALTQASAYLVATPIAIGAYLDLLRSRASELLSEVLPGGPQVTVAAIVAEATARIRIEAAPALDILRFCAFLAPSEIDLDLLTGAGDWLPEAMGRVFTDVLACYESLAVLSRHGMVEQGQGWIRVHTLVQTLVRQATGTDDARRWARAAMLTVAVAFPDQAAGPSAWVRSDRLLPHVHAAVEHALAAQIETEAAAALLDRAASYLRLRGRYEPARRTQLQALQVKESLHGRRAVQLVGSLRNLGLVLQAQGRLAEAREALEQAVDLGVEAQADTDVARLLVDLASVLCDQGRLDAAREVCERGFALAERLHGLEHPDAAAALAVRGVLLHESGDLTGARAELELALGIYERWGADDLDLPAVLGRLGRVMGDLGDQAAARRLHERALAIREPVLGADHALTASSLNDLGRTMRDQGDLEAAAERHRRALTVQERALGPAHPDTSISLNNLARVLHDQGDLAAARPLYERALTIRESALGLDHPLTAASLNNLAGLFKEQGELVTAKLLYEQALAVAREAVGPQHPVTVRIAANLEAAGETA